eukprot:CAMPEP_0170589392 /NCGR_PEP_ID=MMETSP0224-20130122/11326_1 /TAXON_ID=285029 /ORGANISM="Togula jolla, Strain CCCM 725" /LENGTH=262 /DNA_ID=CAMNT_0010913147 /DNA_START=100 /DNA_END=889 /DNA_ORIENTATION=-
MAASAQCYIVRNTFVELLRETRGDSRQRAGSAPAKLRDSSEHMEALIKFALKEEEEDKKEEEEEEDEEDKSTEAGTCEDSFSECSGDRGMELCLASMVAPPGAPSRKMLNTAARAWFPSASPGQTGSMPPQVAQEFSDVVSAGKVALENSPHVEKAAVLRHARGWHITVHCRAAQAWNIQSALALAKMAMLQAAVQSLTTYVIGYDAIPFISKASGDGFDCQLASVSDDSSAAGTSSLLASAAEAAPAVGSTQSAGHLWRSK